MLLLLASYPNKPRDLKRFITGLVSSGLAACVTKINYAKSTYIREGALCQAEEKILLIKLPDKHKEKIIAYFTKNHPHTTPEMIRLQPTDVAAAYSAWVDATAPLSKSQPLTKQRNTEKAPLKTEKKN